MFQNNNLASGSGAILVGFFTVLCLSACSIFQLNPEAGFTEVSLDETRLVIVQSTPPKYNAPFTLPANTVSFIDGHGEVKSVRTSRIGSAYPLWQGDSLMVIDGEWSHFYDGGAYWSQPHPTEVYTMYSGMKLADDSGYFTLFNTGYAEEGYRMDYFLSSPDEVVSGKFTSIYPELITQCGDVIYGAHNKTQVVPTAAPPEEYQLMQLYPLTENPNLAVYSQQLPDGWHLSYTSDTAPCIDGVVYAIGAVSNTGYGAPE
ncbi:MAG: hypothetical protein WBA45_13155, partial [Microthrixaceae bacterium]